ncbi:MAG: GGDEF domain-containing protein [Planctomycetes bacterium]|nr:GGDEF domain-containing protein [Planctomycetota bacterium]
MSSRPIIYCCDPALAERIRKALGPQWNVQVVESLDDAENAFRATQHLALVGDFSDKIAYDWCVRHSHIPMFSIRRPGDEIASRHLADWIDLSEPAEELSIRLQTGVYRWIESNSLLDYANRMKRERNLQSTLNDRLLKVSLELREAKDEIERLSLTDALTQLHNRRYFDIQLERDVLQSLRYKTPLAIYMLDIDNFKHVNDTYGHQVGDEVLIQLSKVIKNTMRETDWSARYGGEEFCVVLPMTGLEGASESARRIREHVESEVCAKKGEALTVSIGVCAFNPRGMSQHDLIKGADEGLYQAKRTGKNKVMYFHEGKKKYVEYSSGKPQQSYR